MRWRSKSSGGGPNGPIEPNYDNDVEYYEAAEPTCDGLDNDCDGKVDEGLDGNPLRGELADNQLGICSGARKVCENGEFVEPDYTEQPGYIADDLLGDLLDTNCDGIIGECERAVFVTNTGLVNWDNCGNTPPPVVTTIH